MDTNAMMDWIEPREQLAIFDMWLDVGFVDLTEYNRLVSGIDW